MWKVNRRHLFLGAGGTALALAARPAGAVAPEGRQIVMAALPKRLYDSRNPGPGSGRLAAGQERLLTILLPGVEPQANNVFINLTVTETLGAGFLRVYPSSEGEGPVPAIHSNINWWADGLNLANLVLVGLGEGSAVVIECGGVGSTHYVVDLVAYAPQQGAPFGMG